MGDGDEARIGDQKTEQIDVDHRPGRDATVPAEQRNHQPHRHGVGFDPEQGDEQDAKLYAGENCRHGEHEHPDHAVAMGHQRVRPGFQPRELEPAIGRNFQERGDQRESIEQGGGNAAGDREGERGRASIRHRVLPQRGQVATRPGSISGSVESNPQSGHSRQWSSL